MCGGRDSYGGAAARKARAQTFEGQGLLKDFSRGERKENKNQKMEVFPHECPTHKKTKKGTISHTFKKCLGIIEKVEKQEEKRGKKELSEHVSFMHAESIHL